MKILFWIFFVFNLVFLVATLKFYRDAAEGGDKQAEKKKDVLLTKSAANGSGEDSFLCDDGISHPGSLRNVQDCRKVWGKETSSSNVADSVVYSWTGILLQTSKKTGQVKNIVISDSVVNKKVIPGVEIGMTVEDFKKEHPGLRAPRETSKRVVFNGEETTCITSYQFSKATQRLMAITLYAVE